MMADSQESIERQVETIILASFAHTETPETSPAEENTTTEEKRVIDVDLYRLEGGAILLIPNDGTNPLERDAVESITPTTQNGSQTAPSESPSTEEDEQQEDLSQEMQPEPVLSSPKRRVKSSFVLIPLVLLLLLGTGTMSYLYLLPLTATATITLTPKARMLHTATTLLIAVHPKAGEVQGRSLAPLSMTKSQTVPATGHGHDDATAATGIITFYNADSQSHTIPAGITFTTPGGETIVTDNAVTVQAAVLPEVGIAITAAHVAQTGSGGNIATHTIYTRCCGSEFLTATNTTAFTGGQDARDYSYIQPSDIHHAASILLPGLTTQASAFFQQEVQVGEQLVTPLCTPHISSSQEVGSEATQVTVTVTQACRSVAYLTNSLNQVATTVLAQSVNLTNYQEVGTVQVTVNGSVYLHQSARLNVSLSGVWVYHFPQVVLMQLVGQVAGQSKEKATAILVHVAGVAQVSIHLQRFDFKDVLPADQQHIIVQFFYMAS